MWVPICGNLTKLLALGQHKDDVDVGVVFVEALYSAHQYGLAGYR